MKKAKPALLRDKMPAPASLNRSVAKAKARTTERRHGPPLWLKRDDSGKIILADGKPVWEWPFADTLGKSPDWAWLVLDSFGTRYPVMHTVFLTPLIDLCVSSWDAETHIWVHDNR